MLKRRLFPLPEHAYPADAWRMVESRFMPTTYERAETIFALSNGYLGIRGTHDEGRPALQAGSFVNGFHDTWKIVHAEDAYGLARTGQTIVNVPDATILKLYVDDEPLFLPTARLRHYSRVLDMRAGTLVRELTWATAAGKRVIVRSTRLVSLEHRHVAAIAYEVVLPDNSAPVAISSQLLNRQDSASRDEPEPGKKDPRVATKLPHRVLHAEIAELDGLRMRFGYRTASSGMTLGVAVEHLLETQATHHVSDVCTDDGAELVITADAEPGVPIRIVKYVTYQSSRSAPTAELVARCERTLERVAHDGFEDLVHAQRRALDRFWDRADVRVSVAEDGELVQQAVRWNIFQVGQATWRAEGAGVPAKGLTGQAYEGHYFWDTEIYVLPFLAYTQPRIARNLLRFRHSMLGLAREHARELNLEGAKFPWRTINGLEASAYYQAGTAQYHINADIAYAILRYVAVRGDDDFLVEVGAEMLVETARLWADLGFHGDDGRFHIHSVTGPDEYTTVVNDNTYTNLMARLNLNYAASVVRHLQEDRPDDYKALAADTRLRAEEVDAWEAAAANMEVPYDERRRIHPQDENFLEREVWDIDATPPEQFPLLLHFHPLVIYRHQVIKQADIVLAMFLLGNEFSPEDKRRNFDYYDALTTGDSSLSACMQAVVAAEIGYGDIALDYFRYALLMDLADVAGNVSDGVHIASAAGVWQALVFGFGGVRDHEGHLSIDPRLPEPWESLEFSVRFRGRQVRVRLAHDGDEVRLDHGDPLEITFRGERLTLERHARPEPAVVSPKSPVA